MEDIPSLAAHFLGQFAEELGRPFIGFSDGALARLEAHAWPGNIRELRNTIERAAILTSGGEVDARSISLAEGGAAGGSDASGWSPETLPEDQLSLDRMEAAMIRRALDVTSGNKGRAARALGIHRSTLYKKLEAYDIEA